MGLQPRCRTVKNWLMKTLDELVVIVSNYESDVMYIVSRNSIESCSITDCYDEYGQLYCEEEVGDIEVKAITYWDGHNYRSIVVGDESEYGDFNYADDELSKKILAEYRQIESPDFREGFGLSKIEGGEFVFGFSQYQNDNFNICSVRRVEDCDL